ncbi:MAG: hypothetical protein M1838_005100 [Thelocarpon superellum]|nr:MAG: hypothetical protein M1838_005100 [Thelocarpon superellum]
MYGFQGDHYSPSSSRRDLDRRNDFSFQSGLPTGPRFPEQRKEYYELPRRPAFEARGSNGSTRPDRDSYRPRGRGNRTTAPSDRPLLRANRETTPEQLAGMNADATQSKRFIPADDVSDSDEQEMEVDSVDGLSNPPSVVRDDVEAGEGPPRKKQMQSRTDSAVGPAGSEEPPKWSNPDPYTALPPLEQSQRKRKDVIKIIRKARVESKTDAPSENPVAANADFISFDLEDDESQSKGDTPENGIGNGTSVVPTGPNTRAFDRQENSSPSRPRSPAPRVPPPRATDAWPPPTVGDALGSRKRTHNDNLKPTTTGVPPKNKGDRGGKADSLTGKVVPSWKPSPRANPTPWAIEDHSATRNMGQWLHQEICDFYDFVKPKAFEQTIRSQLLDRMQRAFNGKYHGSELHSFGSFAAGLYLPNADMDVVLWSKEFARSGKPFIQGSRFYHAVKALLIHQGIADPTQTVVIAKARVPLVKFVDVVTGLKVDLSFDSKTGVVAKDTFHLWKSQYPAMPMLVTLIKQFLMMRDLNEVSGGGVGGFTVTCLVTSLLQLMPQVQAGTLDPSRNLGEILMEFLVLYGKKFDTKRVGICLDPPGYFEKRLNPLNLPYRAGNEHRLSIADPNKEQNDISGGSGQILLILNLFSQAYDRLTQRMDQLRHADLPARRGQSLLGCILAGNYAAFDEQRSRLHDIYVARPPPVPRGRNRRP